jgi:hypothetical protein
MVDVIRPGPVAPALGGLRVVPHGGCHKCSSVNVGLVLAERNRVQLHHIEPDA